EALRRGYATASTDTGHLSSDRGGGIGHPEKAVDYLYRAKHVTTVAAKAIVTRDYGHAASQSYFSSCSDGGGAGAPRSAAPPARLRGADYRRALEFPVAFERRLHLGRPGTRGSGGVNSRGEASGNKRRRGRRV